MQHKKIYLAGPIAGTTFDVSALGWRAYVDHHLSGLYNSGRGHPQDGTVLDCYSPMRGKDFLRDIKKDQILGKLEFATSPVSTKQGILGRDRNDVMTSDLVFMNMLGATETSIGTTVELGWADAYRKPVILVMESEGNVHEHLFYQGLITYRVDNLDDGISLSKLLLLPNN